MKEVTFEEFNNRVTEDCKQQLISKIKQLKELDQETTDEILNILKLKSPNKGIGKTPEEIDAYLLGSFFQDSKHIVPRVLKRIRYSKSEPEKVKLAISEIWNEAFEISFLDMMMSSLDYTEVYKRYLNMINWWLCNFTLDYTKPRSTDNEQYSIKDLRNLFKSKKEDDFWGKLKSQ